MIQHKNNYIECSKLKKLKPQIMFNIKDVFMGVGMEVLYMLIFIVILFFMVTLL